MCQSIEQYPLFLIDAMITDNNKIKSKEKILVIDDELGIRESMRMILEDHCLDIALTSSALEGLEYLTRNDVAIVIMDIKMPS